MQGNACKKGKIGINGQQMYYSTCQLFGIFPLFEFSHKQHVCTALYQCHDGPMVSSSNNRVHLEVPKAFSVATSKSTFRSSMMK